MTFSVAAGSRRPAKILKIMRIGTSHVADVRQRLVSGANQTLATAGTAVLDLVLPPTCRLCNEPVASQQDFCRRCEMALGLTAAAMRRGCRRCGSPGAASNRPRDAATGTGAGCPPCAVCRDR